MDIIVSDGEKYPDFSFKTITASEGIALKARAGIASRAALQQGIDMDDPEAWRALVWLLRKRVAQSEGQPVVRLSDTDFEWGGCKIQFTADELSVIESYLRAEARRRGEDAGEGDEDATAGQEAEAELDPTGASLNT